MFAECQKFLKDALKVAGIRMMPVTSMKKLSLCSESHMGAVIFDEETLSRSGSKTIYRNERGEQQKRQKVFDRNLTFDVMIGEYTADKAGVIYENFLRQLDRGLYVDGNFTAVEVISADWVEKDDSILKAQVAVQVKVKFEGGVYRDTGYINAKDKKLEIRIERANGKEAGIYGEVTGIEEFAGERKSEGSSGL